MYASPMVPSFDFVDSSAVSHTRRGRLRRAHGSLLILAALALTSADCVTKACTEIACSDHFSAKFTTATGAWIDGRYELAVRADDRPVDTCSFRIPDQLPDGSGKGAFVRCGDGVQLNIVSQSQCQMGCDAGACWQSCTPIPGKFDGHLTIRGTPSRVELALVRDSQPILEETVNVTYEAVYPNGPECGGACRQASREIVVP